MSNADPPKDIFLMYQQSIDEFFAGVEKSLPNYHQSVTSLQQEWFQTCENTIKSILSIQREFANNTGLNARVPETVMHTIKATNDEILKAYSAQTQAALTAINVARQNIKSFNDNAGFFADMSKNMVKYWSALFTQKRS